MRRLLNTLYVTSQGGYLFRDGDSIVVRTDAEEKIRVPSLNLENLVCFGNVSVTSPVLALCAERNIGVSFLSDQGRFLARSTGKINGNVMLRRKQYQVADDLMQCCAVARSMITAKISNSRVLLQRARRDATTEEAGEVFVPTIGALGQLTFWSAKAENLELLRGYEGDAARQYFGIFDRLIVAQESDFRFRQRSRRPPLDNVNALLSFAYTILTHDVGSALESVGLDPAVGFMHRDRPGRLGLALDLMEELRPYLADRLVLSLINRKQVSGDGFKQTESGAVVMNDDTRKTLLVAYQNRKREEIEHPFLREKIEVGLLPYAQALLLARYLRGDLDGYPPFLWR